MDMASNILFNLTCVRIRQYIDALLDLTYGLDMNPDSELATELSKLIKGFDQAVRSLAREDMERKVAEYHEDEQH